MCTLDEYLTIDLKKGYFYNKISFPQIAFSQFGEIRMMQNTM